MFSEWMSEDENIDELTIGRRKLCASGFKDGKQALGQATVFLPRSRASNSSLARESIYIVMKKSIANFFVELILDLITRIAIVL